MILDEIVADKKRRLEEHRARISETQMRRLAEETKTRAANCFYENLKKPGMSEYMLFILYFFAKSLSSFEHKTISLTISEGSSG